MIAKIHSSIVAHEAALHRWAEERFAGLEPPIYSSVDLRCAGYKVSVVDTNLFPAGFNNLCKTFSALAAEAFQRELLRFAKAPQKVLILPEAHTRNQYYWANIFALVQILRSAGAIVEVGRFPEIGIDLPERVTFEDAEGIGLKRVSIDGSLVSAESFVPDLILLNNDFRNEHPTVLDNIRQPILPSPRLGWHQRRKSEHFKILARLTEEVGDLLGMDPWFLNPLMSEIRGVDFNDEASRLRLKDGVDGLLERIRAKHREYKIDSEPYVFIKDNAGTYGMAITHVHQGEEVLHLGRRARNKMTSGKGGGLVSDFLLQEGLPTRQSYQDMTLEPVFYLVGGEFVGNFFRMHGARSDRESLNARGMSFDCLCSHSVGDISDMTSVDCDSPDRLRVVGGFLSKLASYAVSLELEGLKEKVAAQSY